MILALPTLSFAPATANGHTGWKQQQAKTKRVAETTKAQS
jgi:hypothetical protein